jgi:hypothetical protein
MGMLPACWPFRRHPIAIIREMAQNCNTLGPAFSKGLFLSPTLIEEALKT